MRVLLVRHGHAGTKEGWTGDDRLRPLDTRGIRQAKHLVGVLVPLAPTRLLSSPYARCLQTMELIAAKTGLTVQEEAALIPNAGQQAVNFIRALGSTGASGRVVACTHGEVIGDVLGELARADGVRLSRRPPGLKGCVWILDFHEGAVATARYISPSR
ncbi:MAG TPA: phosphoglycerate mutase family protein [Acidimicrobiales bacterium]|nr:phosphoglycerate mutase family protein [Acidimicrobiales bacterium]